MFISDIEKFVGAIARQAFDTVGVGVTVQEHDGQQFSGSVSMLLSSLHSSAFTYFTNMLEKGSSGKMPCFWITSWTYGAGILSIDLRGA